jgi:hypothetical protein
MTKFEKENDIKSINTKYGQMTIENGIYKMYYYPLKELNLSIAKEIVRERISFKKGVSYPSLFDIQQVENSTKEARDYMANEGNDLVIASAIIVGSPVIKMMANFFIMVNKPKNPTRMFTDNGSALEWLEQYKA